MAPGTLLSKEVGEGPRLCCPSRVGRAGRSGHLTPGNPGGGSDSPKAAPPPGGQSQEAAGGTKLKEWTASRIRALDRWPSPGIGGWAGRTSSLLCHPVQDPRIKGTQPAGLAQSPSCITTSGCSSGVSPITASADLPQLSGASYLQPPDPGCLIWREGSHLILSTSQPKPGSSPEMVLAGTAVGVRCGAQGRNLWEGMSLGAS